MVLKLEFKSHSYFSKVKPYLMPMHPDHLDLNLGVLLESKTEARPTHLNSQLWCSFPRPHVALKPRPNRIPASQLGSLVFVPPHPSPPKFLVFFSKHNHIPAHPSPPKLWCSFPPAPKPHPHPIHGVASRPIPPHFPEYCPTHPHLKLWCSSQRLSPHFASVNFGVVEAAQRKIVAWILVFLFATHSA